MKHNTRHNTDGIAVEEHTMATCPDTLMVFMIRTMLAQSTFVGKAVRR